MSFIQFQFRRDPAATWTSENPTLAEGELGLETDTGKYKVGNGSTDWVTLTYKGIGSSGYSGYSGLGVSGYSGYSSPGTSGFSGFSAASPGPSGYSGYSGKSGYSGFSGTGESGYSGYSGELGVSGYSGYSSQSGYSGYSGYSSSSGYSGYSGSGVSGYSGFSGAGTSGFSGFSGPGSSGFSGFCGSAGSTGVDGASGYSGYSGYSGATGGAGSTGTSGFSGYSAFSGYSGFSGFSGISGYSGYSAFSGFSGSGYSGYSAYSGFSGISGYSGYSGYSSFSGYSAYSGYSGPQLLTFSTQTDTDYTLVAGDANTGVKMTSAAAHNLTIPLNATVPYATGTQIVIEQAGAGLVTIVPTGGVTLQGATVTNGQYSVVVLSNRLPIHGCPRFQMCPDTVGIQDHPGTRVTQGFQARVGFRIFRLLGFSGYSAFSGFSGVPLVTAGVTTSPTATQTDTITHSLGKTPVIIQAIRNWYFYFQCFSYSHHYFQWGFIVQAGTDASINRIIPVRSQLRSGYFILYICNPA